MSHEFRSLKHKLNRIYRQYKKSSYHFDYDSDLGDISIDFDFANLGETIERTVRTAVEGLESTFGHLDETFNTNNFNVDFSRRRKIPRHKVDPGSNLHFGKFERAHEISEVLPNIDNVQEGLQILDILDNNILVVEDLSTQCNLPVEDLEKSLSKLLDLGLIIQEKSGKQRFMITRKGKKLRNLSNKQEETNN
jgi:predicted transcriptional regulator